MHKAATRLSTTVAYQLIDLWIYICIPMHLEIAANEIHEVDGSCGETRPDTNTVLYSLGTVHTDVDFRTS